MDAFATAALTCAERSGAVGATRRRGALSAQSPAPFETTWTGELENQPENGGGSVQCSRGRGDLVDWRVGVAVQY